MNAVKTEVLFNTVVTNCRAWRF